MSTAYEGINELKKVGSIQEANQYLSQGWVVCYIGNNPFQTNTGYVDQTIIILGKRDKQTA